MKKVAFLVSFIAAFGLMLACGGGSTETKETNETKSAETVDAYAAGRAIYTGKGQCFTCHQKEGQGISGTFPPLAGADYLLADKSRALHQAIYGSKEPIVVNGVTYNGGVMPPSVMLNDEEVRDVVNFILNSWGNQAGEVTLEEVKAMRALGK